MRRQGRGLRAVRGAVAAAVATFVALLSHVSGGGAMPGWVGLVVPLALSFVACTALAGRRLSAGRLAVAVATSQVLFHALFVLGGYDAMAGGHVHGALAPAATAGATAPAVTTDVTMWLWHALAAAATTLALHRGERTAALLASTAARAVAWLRARVRVATTAVWPVPARRLLAAARSEMHPHTVLLASTARRRGPPLPAVL